MAKTMCFTAAQDSLDKFVHTTCKPLFANEYLLHSGHSVSTTNATATFVKRHGHFYAITCHHVLAAFQIEALESNKLLVPSVHGGRLIHQLGGLITAEQYRWSFNSCRDFPTKEILSDPDATETLQRANSVKPDVAIADISSVWEAMSSIGGLSFINMDDWDQPNWTQLQPHMAAYGFPNDHKSRQGDSVAVPMPRIVAKLQDAPSPDRPSFILYSTLDREHGFGFSGVSGGPVVAEDTTQDDLFHFVGIVYEGSPSSTIDQVAQSIFSRSDIFLYCHHLTPNMFDVWLDSCLYGVQFSLKR